MAYVSVKDIFPFFGSNTLGQKELSEYNLTRSIRCLNTGNNAFATSASNTPFNLTTTASPITPGSSSTIEFTLGEGEGEIGGYYVKIENTTSVKLEGNWQAEGVFYLHLNMTSRGLKYVSEYSEINESALELKYASDGIITDREYSLKIAELVESSGKLVVTYSCHRGLINNIDLTYGSMMRERFLGDGIYYYLDKDATTYTTYNSNIKLRKGGIEVKDIDSVDVNALNFASLAVKNEDRDCENFIDILMSGVYIKQGKVNNVENFIGLVSSGISISSNNYIQCKSHDYTFIDIDTGLSPGMVLGNDSYQTTLKGTSVLLKSVFPKIELGTSNITMDTVDTNGSISISSKNITMRGEKSTTIQSRGYGSESSIAYCTGSGSTWTPHSQVKVSSTGVSIGSDSEIAIESGKRLDIYAPGDLVLQTNSGKIGIVGNDIILQNNDEKSLISAKNDTVSIGSDAILIGANVNVDTQKIKIGNSQRTPTNGMTVVGGANTYIEGATAVHIKQNDTNRIDVGSGTHIKGDTVEINGKDITGIMDVVVEEGTTVGWTYRKWKNGRCEAWKDITISNVVIQTVAGSVFITNDNLDIKLPGFSGKTCKYFNAVVRTRKTPDTIHIIGFVTNFNNTDAYIRPVSFDSITFGELEFGLYAEYE